MNKKYLFYLVHPAKFHFHKVQINALKKKGYTVDIIINTKDILEELVIEEGWDYINIFPKTRKIKGVHVYIAAFLSLILSIYRLWKHTKGKKYDIFVGDALVYLGKIKGIPSFYPTDDVLSAVPEQHTWFIPANYIIAPKITDIGKYKRKKIAYNGYKALAHLHPNHFMPNIDLLEKELRSGEPYFLIRCTGFGATHDVNKKGIDDVLLYKLRDILLPKGKLLITSERDLPNDLEKYRINIKKSYMSHYVAFAKIFISDSTTMSTEAAVLGTPSVELDEYFYEIDQMLELQDKYKLIHCYRTNEQEQMLTKVGELLSMKNLEDKYIERRNTLLNDVIDVSSFLVWIFENHPNSTNKYFTDTSIQKKFGNK